MHLVEILLAASIVGAAPFTPEKRAGALIGPKQFSVNQSPPVTPGKKVAGPIALAKALGKYSKVGKVVPQDVQAAAAKAAGNDDGTVAATPEQYDQAYLEPVSIGGQTLQLDFDTGSSDLWVFSTELPSSQQSGHTLYSPSKSKTAKVASGQTWSISYGDGSSSSGNVYTDTVAVGATTVTGQDVELAKTVSSEFQSDPADGLLGLAFSEINTVTPTKANTFFQNALSGLESPLFTVDLKKGQPGSYDFGYIDSSKYTSEPTYVHVDSSQGFWGFTADGYTVGNGDAASTSLAAIADTGTSLLLIQDEVVSAYYAKVSGSSNSQSDGGYIFPCSATLPDLTISIGGYNAVVPGSFVNYAPASASGTCFGGIQSAGDQGFAILGDVFLKSQFVVFDNSVPQLGFAPKSL